jgi:hypothetical protein
MYCRGDYLHYIVMYEHAPTRDKSYNLGCFYEVHKHALDQFLKYNMRIFLIYEKVMREDTFKLTT